MKRRVVAAALLGLVALAMPAAVAADRITKFQDHHVGFFCEGPIDGGFAVVQVDSSTEFGQHAGTDVWFDPAVPFDEPASLTGSTDSVDIVESSGAVDISATFSVAGPDGTVVGQGILTGRMTATGDPEIIGPNDFGNHHSATSGTSQPYEGTAMLTLPGHDLALGPCFGDVTDITVFDANPSSFISNSAGVAMTCSWEGDGVFAAFFAVQDTFGFFADAVLVTATEQLSSVGATGGSLTAGALDATVALQDEGTGDPASATARATFTPIGTPVTSTLLGASRREKVTEQALASDGRLDFSTGESFTMDVAHCQASQFASHTIATSPGGPKPTTKVPVNDVPGGAIALAPGARLNVQTTGTALDPEEPIVTCPEGPRDDFGHTLWYAITGTGDPLTFDTAGSNFDTVVAVYVDSGAGLSEIACIDDVFYEPVGSSFQAALTVPTERGVIYLVQVGGYRNSIFGGVDAEMGRLRVAVR
jgi:hypothetical protein